MSEQTNRYYEFGSFSVDVGRRLLLSSGEPVPLTPKVLETLLVMIENRGRVLTKDELLSQVWGDTIVEEGGLTRNISVLRKALGERPDDHQYIVTVPGRGYQFVAQVQERWNNGKESGTDVAVVAEGDFRPRGTFWARRPLVLGGLATLVLGLAVCMLYITLHQATATHPEIKSIAVLPLLNLSGDPAQEYFADGMTEALISRLAQIRSLKVISRTSVMSFKETKKSLPEIARELRVDAVAEGSLQRENGRIKVMIQLIHGPTDTHLWAREYERALTDVLRLQGEIAQAIAEEIRIQVTPEERTRMASAPTVNPAAHEAYLLGQFHLRKHIIDDNKRAISHFERAIQFDRSYAPAYAGLSMAWQQFGVQARATLSEVEPQARAAAQKALELDDRLPEAYLAQSRLQFFYDWDWTGAENTLRRALELDPNNLDAHYWYSVLLMQLGRFPESIAEIESAERLDPLSHQVQVHFGHVLYRAGRPEEAVLRLRQAIEREPRSSQAYYRLGQVYTQMGRYTEAIEIYGKAAGLRGNPPGDKRLPGLLAHVYALMGERTEARRMLKGLKDTPAAAAHAVLGDKDEAFKLLLRLVEEREDYVFSIKSDPQFAILHSDPRWRDLLARMNLSTE